MPINYQANEMDSAATCISRRVACLAALDDVGDGRLRAAQSTSRPKKERKKNTRRDEDEQMTGKMNSSSITAAAGKRESETHAYTPKVCRNMAGLAGYLHAGSSPAEAPLQVGRL